MSTLYERSYMFWETLKSLVLKLPCILMQTMARRRLLMVFDFDHTMVEENSDIVARKLINADLIPEQVRSLYQTQGWTDYMNAVFQLLHKYKVSDTRILDAMDNLTPTQRMLELLQWLNREEHEIIIISDSNSVFITQWLRHNNLQDFIQRIFTNPGSFAENGLLSIQPYMDQDWCKLSTRNLCKGHILESYIKERLEEGVKFDSVAYAGDGQNDLCPALRLSKSDLLFPRVGFALEKLINNLEEGTNILARIYPWVSAGDILKVLQNEL